MSLEARSARINHDAPRPLWQQVADDLRADITAGRLAAGVRLPAEHELAAQYGVSRVTVCHSIKELVDEHLVEVVQGRGTFVTDLSPGERQR
jgi:DNA-binding GntR family transcriptional regulator